MYASTSKRRRTSMSSTASLASRGDDDTGSLDLEYQPDTKRKKVIKLDPIEQCQQLYDIIRNHKKEDGTVLCEPFIRVPKRRQEPSYYEVVKNPMDMIKIQQKIKMDEYEDVDQMAYDVDVLVMNAKAFYKRSSPEYKDALELWDLFVDSKCRLFDRDSPFEDGERKGKIILKMGKLARRAAVVEAKKPLFGDIDGGETSESSTTTDKGDRVEEPADGPLAAQLEELFSAVMLANDADGRSLHTVFQLLPSKKRYPEYYDVIDNPIDLKMIATKIQTGIYAQASVGEYNGLYEMEKDLHLMCKNACAFNEPGSQIYKDAKALKKIVSAKKLDIEHGRPTGTTPGKTSERIRNRRLRSGLSHSAITAALSYEDDEEDDDIEDEELVEEEPEDGDVGDDAEDEDMDVDHVDDAENPMWILYDSVNSITSASGAVLTDPFRRLPSRRFYPDYYKEIKSPISMSQIKMRIRRGEYVNLTQVQADMNIMFENAKAYNRPDSSLYKTAVKLQKAMQSKVQELLEGDEDVSNDDPIGIKGTTTPIPLLTPETDAVTPAQFSSMSPLENSSNTSGNKTPNSGGKKIVIKAKPKESPNMSSFTFAKNLIKDEKGQKPTTFKDQMKRRYMILFQKLIEHVDPDGRGPISMFMEKPSKKLYPDYYRVIPEPIDMITIKGNIESDMYTCTAELIKDFQLMFNNCRQYNEEGSAIYEDANKLEKLLSDTMKDIGPDPTFKTKTKKKKNPVQMQKQRKLLDTIKDHKDKNGRMLSSIFQKLPSKMEYPEYHEVIKNPIDLDRIMHKQRTNAYESLDQLSADIMLMFDNACKFNEPDSQIYKDALILQRLVLQTKLSLSADDNRVPDVASVVREILISIFTSVYNHQDEEGRCFTDTMAELPEFDEVDGQKVRATSLDLIKSRLDRGFYKRLDTFQKDIFLCFERARKFSRTDSQLFEDSVELHSYFIRTRDEICGRGETLKSPALLFTQADLDKSVDALRAEKKSQETPQDEDLSLPEVKKEETIAAHSLSESYNEQTYCVGDFVYVSASPNYNGSELLGSDGANQSASTANSSKGAVKPNIANIQRLYTGADGVKMFEGIFFFRPDQTYHIPTRKFLEKEVFRSEVRSTAQLSEIVGKCWVMTVKGKEYFNYAPEGYANEDIYVCEYRYSSRGRSFCKLKSWAFGSERVKLIARPKSLEPIRVASVFRERLEKHKEELQHLEDDVEKVAVEEFPNIELAAPIVGKEDLTFYIQYSLPCGPIRAGDYVYVRVENAKKLIAKVDTMWADTSGTTYFHGPWFTSLAEISPSSVGPGRTFYKQEIFQSSIEDTNPLLSICGKCSVLEVNEFTRFRLTEIPESDVYVCESMYEEARRQIKKFDGLKKTEHHDRRVHQDEVYFFRRPISLAKVDIEGNSIPEMPKLKVSASVVKIEPQNSPLASLKLEVDSSVEDSNDGAPPSLAASETPSTPSIPTPATPSTPVSHSTKKSGKTPGKKIVTGYILYSSEVRKFVAEKNPTSGFGEISRIVGNDWRKMSATEKQVYEERAARMNEEKEAKLAAGIDPAIVNAKNSGGGGKDTDMVSIAAALKKDPDWIFECCWDGCDWQFEDALDLIEHCVQEPKGHVSTSFKEPHIGKEGKNVPTEGEYQCHWKNCARVKKGVNPFPTLPRLLKHVKDIHILKGNGRIIHPDMRSKKLMVSRNPKPKAPARPAAKQTPNVGTVGNIQLHNKKFMMPPTSPPLGPAAVTAAQVVQPVIVRAPPPPPEPLFVAVPPRPHKILHSEAYIKYIEGLHNENRQISNWEKTLNATAKTTSVPDSNKLPSHWLRKDAATSQEDVVKSLWALRDFMLRDHLNLRRGYP